MNIQHSLENWKRTNPVIFHFDPGVNSVTLEFGNDYYNITSLKTPCVVKLLLMCLVYSYIYFLKITKKNVDKTQYESALLYLKYKVNLKYHELKDLRLTLQDSRDKASLVLTGSELQKSFKREGTLGRHFIICNILICYTDLTVATQTFSLCESNPNELLGI